MLAVRWGFARSGLLLDVVWGKMSSILLVRVVDCGNSLLVLMFLLKMVWLNNRTCEGESELIEALSGELRP